MKKLIIIISLIFCSMALFAVKSTWKDVGNGKLSNGIIYSEVKPGDIISKDVWRVMGKLTNPTGKRIKSFFFKVILFDNNKELIDTSSCCVGDIKSSDSKYFDCPIVGPDYDEIYYYKLED